MVKDIGHEELTLGLPKQDKYQKYYDQIAAEDARIFDIYEEEVRKSYGFLPPTAQEVADLLDDAEKILDVAKLYEEKCQDFYGQTHQRLIRFFEQLMKEVSKYG